jgi:hypothetical protein
MDLPDEPASLGLASYTNHGDSWTGGPKDREDPILDACQKGEENVLTTITSPAKK